MKSWNELYQSDTYLHEMIDCELYYMRKKKMNRKQMVKHLAKVIKKYRKTYVLSFAKPNKANDKPNKINVA